jgi:hypothetical protein
MTATLLQVLDESYRAVDGVTLARIAPQGLKESDYDALIRGSMRSVESALVVGGVLEQDSTLVVLSEQQVLSTGRADFLCAELGPQQRLRRLVVIEDKLLRNPEARYQVVGQILKYAYSLQKAGVDEIGVPKTLGAAWVEQNRVDLELCLRDGRFLLVIAGDRIHEHAEAIVRWMGEMLSHTPTTNIEVATLNLAIFEGTISGTNVRLLVPSVAGIVRLDRTMTIRVRVLSETGEVLPAQVVHEDVATSPTKVARSTHEFLEAWETTTEGVAHAAAVRTILHALVEGIHGLEVGTTDRGAPVVRYPNSKFGDVTVFHVQEIQRTLADGLHVLVQREPSAATAAKAFKDGLLALGGTATATGRVHVPLALAAERVQDIVSLVRELLGALSD